MASRLRRWLLGALVVSSVAYPIALAGVWLALRFIGESWWVTAFALYLPPLLFAVPLPLLALALLWLRRRRLLALQLVSLLLLVFPLMGLRVAWPGAAEPGRPTLRVMSYNVNSTNGGGREIAAEIIAHDPQIVFLQELPDWKRAELEAELAPKFPHRHADSEFLVASSFPLRVAPEPAPFMLRGKPRSPRYLKYEIETPLGPVTFFNFHAISPRSDFYNTRGQGFRRELASGRLFERAVRENMLRTGAERRLQAEAVSTATLREPGPVIVVGDTNLPPLSGVRRNFLGHLRDGYADVSFGFGYTYPTRFPWMRIDVILSSDHLRFTRFSVGSGRASDHRAVVAELTSP